jgi:sn-glycerol 3-phosphate transport system permease protein
MNKRLPISLAFIMLAVPCSLLFSFTHYPAIQALINSFWNNASSRRPSRFAGIENYQAFFDDDRLAQMLVNSTIYALGTVPLAISLAIGMALLVNSRLPGTTLMRLSFFMPTMLPMIAVANIWLFFYAPGIGLASQILGVFGLPSINFLGRTDTSLASMMFVAVWKEAGFLSRGASVSANKPQGRCKARRCQLSSNFCRCCHAATQTNDNFCCGKRTY